ncbi:TPA: type II toxin-antitoxin system RelB/DinJ family antitoxin [Streptococcus pneumoniae]|uniref:Acyl-ACP desaturase n=1 Tax=Streptococcus pneumoniae TaxID=1313 RepID=A0A098ZEL1_STREE|nr:type II toxin-antitoxin system RelB/DinJ family antitoxin [Streptococcus pneumoniae]EPD18579.1 plasmid stabilization system, antitoxin protein [Streptococcus pneumoniae MNZ41]ETE11739.1 acyl-ACP desaturase [Streptococcus pneumoniae 13856]ETE27608.1 acyl-ACP desaturase [Streptococcus pneumoniae 1719]OYL07834.1 acyl-ACP desaturase [Streptococcus pneumoniae B1598]OYL08974.1 acyl-ACP desaturase [Streptococcus pneumoniae B1599]
MSTLTRDRVYNFRVNTQLFEEAKTILESKNISLSDALNLFVEQIVLEKGLPIKTADQLKAEVFLGELKAELDKGYQDIIEGRLYDADEVFSQYGL